MKSGFKLGVFLSVLFATQNYILFNQVVEKTKAQFDDELLSAIISSQAFKDEVEKQTEKFKHLPRDEDTSTSSVKKREDSSSSSSSKFGTTSLAMLNQIRNKINNNIIIADKKEIEEPTKSMNSISNADEDINSKAGGEKNNKAVLSSNTTYIGDKKNINEPTAKGEKSSIAALPLSLSKDLSDEDLAEWKANVCGSMEDNICRQVVVVPKRHATFCSAAVEASATMKQYFFDIADGSVVIPKDAKFGVHEANWKRFGDIGADGREFIFRKPQEWTHVLTWNNVVERFVSGYLTKVVRDCKNNKNTIKAHLTMSHYSKFGFSCEKHTELEAFIDFMEQVKEKNFEAYFKPQTKLCGIGKFPFTDIFRVDQNLTSNLEALSSKLGVTHPEVKTYHTTISKNKMADLFKGKPQLVNKILQMFKEDCAKIPQACDVEDLMTVVKSK